MQFSITLMLAAVLFLASLADAGAAALQNHYIRYKHMNEIRYGILEEEQVQELSGGLFPMSGKSGKTIPLEDIKLLVPVDARKVFAVGMNYSSHLSSASNAPPPLFLKLPSSLAASGETLMIPSDASNLHFEGELVLVIGNKGKEFNSRRRP